MLFFRSNFLFCSSKPNLLVSQRPNKENPEGKTQNHIKNRRHLSPEIFHGTEERVRAREGGGAKERKVKRRGEGREISLKNE